VNQVHVNYDTRQLESESILDQYYPQESNPLKHIYKSHGLTCNPNPNPIEESNPPVNPNPLPMKSRLATVFLKCCDMNTINNYKVLLQQQHDLQYTINYYAMKAQTFIENVYEPTVCEYVLHICTELLCDSNNSDNNNSSSSSNNNIPSDVHTTQSSSSAESQTDTVTSDSESLGGTGESTVPPATATTTTDDYYNSNELQDKIYSVTRSEQILLREKVRKMFFHGYYGYLNFAFPEGELKPISCTGE
jgi:hypothetical protein